MFQGDWLVSLLRYTFLLKHLCIFFFSFFKAAGQEEVQSIWSCRISSLFHHLPLHQLAALGPIFIFSLIVNFSENSMFMLWMGKIISDLPFFKVVSISLVLCMSGYCKIPRVVKIKECLQTNGRAPNSSNTIHSSVQIIC